MARSRLNDPIQKFRYVVEIEGVAALGFSKVSGLETELEVSEYREGGYQTTHKLPGIQKTGTLTLERGATSDLQMYNWYRQALTNPNFRKTVTVIEQNALGLEIRRHVCYEAWASKFTRPELDASSSDVAVDQIEIQYEDIDSE